MNFFDDLSGNVNHRPSTNRFGDLVPEAEPAQVNPHVIKIGSQVLTRKWGVQEVLEIQYDAGEEGCEQRLRAVHISDCNNERYIFTLTNYKWAYGSQIASIALAREIFPDVT